MGMIERSTKATKLMITVLIYAIIVYFCASFCDCFEVAEAGVDATIRKCLNFRSTLDPGIQCHSINVKSAVCLGVKDRVPTISIPTIPENKNGEIYCTSSLNQIKYLSFQGYQMPDYMNITIVRKESSLKNESRFKYIIGFALSPVRSPIGVRVGFAKFHIYRPGTLSFFTNLRNHLYHKNGAYQLPLNQYLSSDQRTHLIQQIKIPCILSNPHDTNITLSTVPADGYTNFTFDPVEGFTVILRHDSVKRYICNAIRIGTNEMETVIFDVHPIPVAVIEVLPETHQVYLFDQLPQRIVCKSYEETSSFEELVMKTNLTIEGHLNGRNLTSYPTIYRNGTKVDKRNIVVRYGDSGFLQCRKPDDHVLKNWTIQTIDPNNNNSVLQLIKLSEQTVACKSETFSINEIKLQSIFCQGDVECSLNQFCFDKMEIARVNSKKSPCTGKTILGSPCMNQSNSVCLQLSQDHSGGAGLHSQGMVQCTVGKHSYRTNYVIGFDKILYLNWKTANESALINISTPNKTLTFNKPYPFVCKASKFLSDGILQWGIWEDNRNKVKYLEGDQVQDVYRKYATEQDYKLYTVRESMIMLNYSTGFDLVCRAPVMNIHKWKKHYKRINLVHPGIPGKSSQMLTIIVSCSGGVIILLLGAVLFVTWRWRKAKNALRNLTEEEVEEFFHGNPETSGESTPDLQAHELVNKLSYDRKFEISREKLQIDMTNVLGKGEFGTVCKGTVEGIRENVAVKFLNNQCDVDRFKGFLKELKIMIYIGNHENIVSLIGASTEKIREKTLFIVVEFCVNGSLESYLRKYKSSFISRNLSKEIQPISKDQTSATIDLLKWSYQISNGMEHLASKKVIHADLAARNVLLDCKLNAKITDFGLSRRLYDYTQYVKQKREPLPWRWLSLESLRQLQFSTQSDVWSFGVLLWEIFSLGDIPYPGLNWGPHFVRRLEDGLRMTKPLECPDEIFKLMLNCWKVSPEKRPTFDVISQYFKNLLDSYDGNICSDRNENGSEPELDYLDIQYFSQDCTP